MSGSPSTKFIGRSFNDQVTHKGYKSEAGLAQPAGGKSFLVVAHVRINGGLFNMDEQDAPVGIVLANEDDFQNPTKGFQLGVAVFTEGLDPGESYVQFVFRVAGGGQLAMVQFQVNDAAGMFGRDLFLHGWFDAQDQVAWLGFNGKWFGSDELGEDFEPATGEPTELGALEGFPLNCNNGLVSIATVGIYEAEDQLDNDQTMQSALEMACASMKYGTLTLFDPAVPNFDNQNAFFGKSWTHYWKPGTTAALAPQTLPDTGDAANLVPLNLECAPDEAPLVVADTGFASGTMEESTGNIFAFAAPEPAPPEA